MKFAFSLLIVFIVLPATALSHGEIYFPKLISPAELKTTGIVLLNPDPTAVNVTFYLISPQGSLVSSTHMQIGPGAQIAKIAGEVFPDAATDGWIGVSTDAEEMEAFWLTYDAEMTYLDGGQAAQIETTGADQVIPLAEGDTELTVLCLSGLQSAAPVTVRLFGSDGRELAPEFTEDLPSIGALRMNVSEMFPSADMKQARYMRITSKRVASSALIKRFHAPFEAAVVNGVNVDTGTELIVPHVVNGKLPRANYTTTIGATNLSDSPQTVTITFHPDTGSPVVVVRDLVGNGALRETAQSLFGLSFEFQSGWVSLTGTAPITGFATYADDVGGGLAAVSGAASERNLFFSHIANGLPQWQTGLALLNATSTPADVEVYVLNPSGSLVGKTALSIDPETKIARVIHELIPETRGMNGGYIYVRSTNDVPLYGMELFYTQDLKLLSNAAAGGQFVPVAVICATYKSIVTQPCR